MVAAMNLLDAMIRIGVEGCAAASVLLTKMCGDDRFRCTNGAATVDEGQRTFFGMLQGQAGQGLPTTGARGGSGSRCDVENTERTHGT